MGNAVWTVFARESRAFRQLPEATSANGKLPAASLHFAMDNLSSSR